MDCGDFLSPHILAEVRYPGKYTWCVKLYSKQTTIDYKELKWLDSYEYIIGVDEVGRGCVAGPICAAAVIVQKDTFADWMRSGVVVKDSKKLSPLLRKKAFEWVGEHKIGSAYSCVSAQDIDVHGITWANKRVMQKVVDECLATLHSHTNILVVSDHVQLDVDQPHMFFPHADVESWSVALASIMAKYQRDEHMKMLSQQYTVYGFDKHKGYGTSAHMKAIQAHGLSHEHRRSFLKNIIETGFLS